jgi:hypothetical protein
VRSITAILALVGVVSLAVLAWAAAADEFAQSGLDDADRVWCDANRALVGLSAETLQILPEDLVDRRVNLASDDPDDAFANLEDLTPLAALRLFRSLVEEAPPQLFSDIGYRTETGFEGLDVLASRAHDQSAGVVDDWISQLASGWDHPDAVRACLAAAAAFR